MGNINKKPMLPIVWIFFHAAIGVVIAQLSVIATLWSLAILVIGSYQIYKNKNRNEEAILWSAYIAVSDVPLRASGGALLWEIGKAGIVMFLLLGIISERNRIRKIPQEAILMFLLLIPGAIITFTWSDNVREALTFNLSGMVCLLVSMIYFYHRQISYSTLKRMFSFSLLPVITLSMVLFYRTPDINTIEFTSSANFAMSGGFGPNQVATILGYGWMAILLMICMKERVTFSKYLTYAILIFILYRSLFTFSRGGNLAAILAFAAFMGVYMLSGHKRINISNSMITLAIFGLLSLLVVNSLNTATDGVFGNRFTGRDTEGEFKEDVTSGRENILEMEYELFKQNPTGVGVGGSRYFRLTQFKDNHASHNEFGRLLSEHGLFGIIVILIMLFSPLAFIRKLRKGENKAYCLMFLVLAVASMMHSGCRTALPEYVYGLSFIYLIQNNNDNNPLYRQQTI